MVKITKNHPLGKSYRKFLFQILVYVPVILVAVMLTIPFIWAVSTSLKETGTIYVYPPKWIPTPAHWENYLHVFIIAPFAKFFENTFIVVGMATMGQMACTSLVAYGFSRFKFPGRGILFLLALSVMMIPGEMLLIPRFLIFKYLGWIDTLKTLIVPSFFGSGIGGAFSIFLLRQFFLTIPRDLDDAAKIDGCSSFRIFWQIILPLCKPVLASIGIFSFIWNWNELLNPMIYLQSTEKFTLSVGLMFFQTSFMETATPLPMENLLMAAAVLTTIPCIIVFLWLQKYFIRGIVLSGIKG
jgi:ABC-type glycerol-3-phosphate transport system permease component